jgi:PKD repeat protein
MFTKTICLVAVFFTVYARGMAQEASPFPEHYITDCFTDPFGREIREIQVPGKLPALYRAPVAIPTSTAVLLDSVPAFIWSFGCSSTAAAMAAGYYDLHGYPDVYTGPANCGQIPMDNSYWGMVTINGETRNQCPLSATMLNLDERVEKGHLDDYWISTCNYAPDPYIANGWIPHVNGDCTGDFMGTSQSAVGNVDGTTRFFFLPDGSPLNDYTGSEPVRRDGCHGLRMFYESRGYPVIENYTRLIRGMYGNTLGFTFEEFKEEIDNKRPVILQLTGHSMLGFGYDEPDIVYLHDTWDFDTHSMTWGGNYAGMNQWGVTNLRLEADHSPPFTDFIGSPVSVIAGQSVYFTDVSSYSPTTWQWTFEGGSPPCSSDPDPVISYNSAGKYAVSLVTANDNGYDSKTLFSYINVYPPPVNKTLNLKVFLEGLFNTASGLMNKACGQEGSYSPSTIDNIDVELRDPEDPFQIIYQSVAASLDQDGNCGVLIPDTYNGDYYIVIRHRNSLETWSANPVSFNSPVIIYDFSSAAASAFGNNLKLIGNTYCIYSGDVNQDGVIDSTDINQVENQASAFAAGYLPEDVNGDGILDSADLIMVDNNASVNISLLAP